MTIIPISSIDEHPLLKGLPMWAANSREMVALTHDVGERGIDQPLLVVGAGTGEGRMRLVDGRHRLAAARAAGLAKVPCIVRAENEAVGIILHSLVDRRHLSKSAQAYLCYPVLAANHSTHGGARRSTSIESTLKSAEALGAKLGFSRDLFFQARAVHERFASRPDLRERFEPSIMEGAGLGAVLAGMAGQEATLKKPKRVTAPEQLLFDSFRDISIRFERWDHIPPPKRREVAARFCDMATALPYEVQAEVAATLQAILAAKGRS